MNFDETPGNHIIETGKKLTLCIFVLLASCVDRVECVILPLFSI
jgi:hypothetical protein